MLRNLLIYRFGIFNLLLLVGLAYAAERGLVGFLIEDDRTGIVFAIAALFAITWAGTLRRVLRVSRALNEMKVQSCWSSDPQLERERAKDLEKQRWMKEAANWMAGLGLIGTVIGFTIAIAGVDENALAEASGVQAAIGELMAGMRIALNTTIAGAICSIVTEINLRMLRTATECYWQDRLARNS